MNQKPIFETSYLGSKVVIYPDRLIHKMLLKQNTIPIQQIASIDLGIPLYAGVTIETTGGKKYKIPIKPFSKKQLEEAIYQAKTQLVQPTKQNDLGDLEKLNDLKEKGIISEEEFQAKKKQILGL